MGKNEKTLRQKAVKLYDKRCRQTDKVPWSQYNCRIIKLPGGAFHVYGPETQLVLSPGASLCVEDGAYISFGGQSEVILHFDESGFVVFDGLPDFCPHHAPGALWCDENGFLRVNQSISSYERCDYDYNAEYEPDYDVPNDDENFYEDEEDEDETTEEEDNEQNTNPEDFNL